VLGMGSILELTIALDNESWRYKGDRSVRYLVTTTRLASPKPTSVLHILSTWPLGLALVGVLASAFHYLRCQWKRPAKIAMLWCRAPHVDMSCKGITDGTMDGQVPGCRSLLRMSD